MLTPIDIQNHKLKATVGGYNKKDTDAFLTDILTDYETLFRENRDLKEKITSLSEGIQYYKKMENNLQKALVLAEKTSTETQEEAKKQADASIKDAREKADSIIKEAHEKADLIIKEANESASSITVKTDAIANEAKAGADAIMREAKEKADAIKAQAHVELDEAKKSAGRLLQSYEEYRVKFKNLVSSQLELIESVNFDLRGAESETDGKNAGDGNDAKKKAFDFGSGVTGEDIKNESAGKIPPINDDSANSSLFTFIDNE